MGLSEVELAVDLTPEWLQAEVKEIMKISAENLIPLLKKASAIRASIISDNMETNCFRLIDGQADGVKDLIVDNYNGHLLAQSSHPEIFDNIILGSPYRSLYFKHLTRHEKSDPVYVWGEKIEGRFEALENDLKYWIDFSSGYSQGIFLDQRENRAWVKNHSQNKEVLNLFSYTCAFSVAAAAGGAKTTSVDLSKNYLRWGKDNFELNKLDLSGHSFLADDCVPVLQRLVKRGRKFDGIILDPPSFSRNKRGKSMSLEKDLAGLVKLCAALLKDSDSWLQVSSNLRKFSPDQFEKKCREGFEGHAIDFKKLKMPKDFRDHQYLHAARIKDLG